MVLLRLLLVDSFHALAVLPQNLLIMRKFTLVKVLIQRDHIHQEVKDFNLSNHLLNVASLQRFSTRCFRMKGCPMRQLGNEHLTSECEEDRRLRRNHSHIFITLHDFLDSGEGQLLLLERIEVVLLLSDLFADFFEFFVQFD